MPWLPESPTPAVWASALGRMPNRKFAATARAYELAGFAPAGDAAPLVAANVEFAYRYYGRLARLRYEATRRQLLASVDEAGAGPLRDAVARATGVLLVSAHLGDFDIAGSWLAQVMGVEVVVVLDPVAEAVRKRWFDAVRGASGVILRRRGATRLEDVEADLRRGRIVLFMLDRRMPGPGVAGELLGRPALLPVAPYVLARRTGAEVVCGTTITRPDGRRELLTERQPARCQGECTAAGFLDPLAQAVTRHVRRCPWQWHVPARLDQLACVSARLDARPAPSFREAAYDATADEDGVTSAQRIA